MDSKSIDRKVAESKKRLQDIFDSLSRSALRVKAERDFLLAACERAYAELDERYDVDEDCGSGRREYPFRGAGEVMNVLKRAIDKAKQ